MYLDIYFLQKGKIQCYIKANKSHDTGKKCLKLHRKQMVLKEGVILDMNQKYKVCQIWAFFSFFTEFYLC